MIWNAFWFFSFLMILPIDELNMIPERRRTFGLIVYVTKLFRGPVWDSYNERTSVMRHDDILMFFMRI